MKVCRPPELNIRLDMNVEWGVRDNIPPSEGRGMVCEWAVDGGVKVSWTPVGSGIARRPFPEWQRGTYDE